MKRNKTMKKCKICGTKKNVKSYVIADDMENPQPYCRKCWLNLMDDILLKLAMENPELKKPPVCFTCKNKMEPIKEKDGNTSKYSFHCLKCYPNLIISIG